MPPPAVTVTAKCENARSQGWYGSSGWSDDLLYCDPTRQLIDSFKIADVTYKVRRPLMAYYEPPVGPRAGRFFAVGLEKWLLGKGMTLEESKRDWQLKVDHEVQRLHALQDFEQTDRDNQMLRSLGRYFDLNEIRYSRPIISRLMGSLESTYPRPYKVAWVDGSTSQLNREQIPAEMSAFREGRPFEAIIERDARTWKLLRIVSAFPCSALPHLADDEAEELLSSVSNEKLPRMGWD